MREWLRYVVIGPELRTDFILPASRAVNTVNRSETSPLRQRKIRKARRLHPADPNRQ